VAVERRRLIGYRRDQQHPELLNPDAWSMQLAAKTRVVLSRPICPPAPSSSHSWGYQALRI
jgi:hypothetical protein